MTDSSALLSRTEASDAVSPLGWRYLMNDLQTTVPVQSMDEAARLATRLVEVIGEEADDHLRLDLRPGLVSLTLQTARLLDVTARDVQLAHAITELLPELGLQNSPTAGPRASQVLELAIDTMDTSAIRPFWRAVLGYGDEPSYRGEPNSVVDPRGQGPSIWFQQMDEPRTQRNRIHFDVTVAHDEAAPRIEAALAAGGRLLSDKYAPSFWILGDADGNEICVCTWQGRDDD
ncbi:MAG: 4a-hydroxytetrahydrobiopterin dehydratase [Frankiales bacterium]|jgi:4a-hydroxytetrahydrobiopterin dehydratase|nr:4a-hydroxytetrahydrobiopterin dehydratase [Frankiales bacterium]